MQQARYLVTGATGFIASALIERALRKNQGVIALSRHAEKCRAHFQRLLPKLAPELLTVYASASDIPVDSKIDTIVHLAGANVFALPWSKGRKQTLLRSRLDGADALRAWIAKAKHAPKCWLQASAVGFYATQSASALDESASPGSGFASGLCQAIEASCSEAAKLVERAYALRIGLVLGRAGGVYPGMRLAALVGAGAVLGSGAQIFPWIHIHDVVSVIEHLSAQTPASGLTSGPVNLVAPARSSNQEFTKALSAQLRRPSFLRAPAWALRLGLGQRAPLLLEGAEIVPKRLVQSGFAFEFDQLSKALQDLA